MVDEVGRILAEMVISSSPEEDKMLPEEANFDEAGYLRLNPDVAASIACGEYNSGYEHYVQYGFTEGRPISGLPNEPANRILRPTNALPHDVGSASEVPFSIEAMIICKTGGVFIVGWVDDTASPLQLLRVGNSEWRVAISRSAMIRVRRGDVEQALGRPAPHRYGYVGFVYSDEPLPTTGLCVVQAWLENGSQILSKIHSTTMEEIELRDVLLSHIASADFYGNPYVEQLACLENGFGAQIVAFNRAITNRLTANPYVQRFGNAKRRFRGSIIMALYGKAEYMHVQNALYSNLPGIEDYEFIYVSNSPELGEVLLREAKIGNKVYGIDQVVVVLPGNAGFGAANNAAVPVMHSDRVMNVNPDVFPYDPAWARKHTHIIERGGQGTRIFGAPLYYDDGSLMHGGMYFEADEALSVANNKFVTQRMLRVEHYGKGAPPNAAEFLTPRPVPAVTGAFISSTRSWFEQLGGFTEDFVFGHYEDADLCLKSLEQGEPSWMQDIRMWHLEGKGSTRLPPHEGGSTVNRWLFSRRWNDLVTANLLGQHPTHSAFSQQVPVSIMDGF